MESSVLTSLSLVFLAAGFTLLTTSLMLSRRARRYRRGMQSLLQIGAQGLDPMNIPAAAWPVLRDAGWRSMTVTGHWFGAAVNIELGQQPAATGAGSSGALEVQVRSGDVDLVLRLQHSAKGGENWMFAEQIARVFVLLFETGVGARTEALAVSMAERARLSLYLQHDMRNLAQWVGWVCTDFAACQDEESLLTAARRLKENTPLAQERVHRLRTALSQKSGSDNPRVVELQLVVRKAAHLAGIDVELSGTAQAWIARGLLARVLDNLFSNLSPNWREIDAVKPVCRLRMIAAAQGHAAQAEIELVTTWPQAEPRLDSSKLFEPFTSGRPGGQGLGLYQARKSLSEAGGDLTAHAGEQGLTFRLRMPAEAP